MIKHRCQRVIEFSKRKLYYLFKDSKYESKICRKLIRFFGNLFVDPSVLLCGDFGRFPKIRSKCICKENFRRILTGILEQFWHFKLNLVSVCCIFVFKLTK